MNVVLVHNFTDQRAHYNISVDGQPDILNNSLPGNLGLAQTGQHVVYNDSTLLADKMQRFEIVVNGKMTKKWTYQNV